VLDQHAHFLGPSREVHRAADAGGKFRVVGRPVREIAVFRHLERAEQREIEMKSADHQERVGVVNIAAALQQRHRLLPGIDEVEVDLVVARRRPDPEHAVFALQYDLAPLGQHIGDEGRQPDPEIDVDPVAEVLRGAPGDLLAAKRHRYSP
jgi:hypothetical protein